jgi:hypothetical protein
MSRAKISTILVLLATFSLATGCTRSDPTGPSASPQPAYEHQGGNN